MRRGAHYLIKGILDMAGLSFDPDGRLLQGCNQRPSLPNTSALGRLSVRR
jgi:hypothetical protein